METTEVNINEHNYSEDNSDIVRITPDELINMFEENQKEEN